MKTGENDYKFSDLDTLKNEISEELKVAENYDLEDMVFKMELKYNEFAEIFDTNYFTTSSTGYTLLPGIYEISDLSLMLNSSIPVELKVDISNDDIRLR